MLRTTGSSAPGARSLLLRATGSTLATGGRALARASKQQCSTPVRSVIPPPFALHRERRRRRGHGRAEPLVAVVAGGQRAISPRRGPLPAAGGRAAGAPRAQGGGQPPPRAGAPPYRRA